MACCPKWLDPVFEDMINARGTGRGRYVSQEELIEGDESHGSATVIETADALIYEIDVPGVSKENLTLQLNVEEGFFIIEGTRKTLEKSQFTMVRGLPDNIVPNKVTSKLENGVLTITFPKVPKVKPVTVTIG